MNSLNNAVKGQKLKMVTRFTIFNESPSHWVCQQNAENEIVGVARTEVAS